MCTYNHLSYFVCASIYAYPVNSSCTDRQDGMDMLLLETYWRQSSKDCLQVRNHTWRPRLSGYDSVPGDPGSPDMVPYMETLPNLDNNADG